jgi:hypothetical protein
MADTTPFPAPELPGVTGAHPLEAAKDQEVVAAGAGRYGMGSAADLLTQLADDALESYGDRLYEEMRREPAVGGSIGVLKFGILSGEASVLPNPAPKPGEREDDSDRRADLDRGKRNADFCRWALDQLERPIGLWLDEMLDCLLLCGKAAEKVFAVEDRGPYKGYLRFDRLPVKPRDSWALWVNKAKRVLGVQVVPIEGVAAVVLPREKFAIMTWGERDSDPRGNSLARAAYKPWEIRVRLWPEFYRYLQQFSRPIPVGKLPADLIGSDAEEKYLAVLEKVRNGATLLWPSDGDVSYLSPPGSGEVFERGFDLTKREIVQAILLSTRMTLEARFGSKADSSTSEDLYKLILRLLRYWAERFVEWELFYPLCYYNFGPEDARFFCPTYSLGDVSGKDVATLAQAFAAMGYKAAKSHLPVMDSQLGLPPRDADDEILGGSTQPASDAQDAADANAKPASDTKAKDDAATQDDEDQADTEDEGDA